MEYTIANPDYKKRDNSIFPKECDGCDMRKKCILDIEWCSNLNGNKKCWASKQLDESIDSYERSKEDEKPKRNEKESKPKKQKVKIDWSKIVYN